MESTSTMQPTTPQGNELSSDVTCSTVLDEVDVPDVPIVIDELGLQQQEGDKGFPAADVEDSKSHSHSQRLQNLQSKQEKISDLIVLNEF